MSKSYQKIIDNEILVDCYDDEEINAAWAVFFEESLEYPFAAKAPLKRKNGSIETVEVEVVGAGSDNYNSSSKKVEVVEVGSDKVVEVLVEKLQNIENEENKKALAIWAYWKDNG